MQEPKYERHHHTITDISTRKRTLFASVNKAKQESRKLQLSEDGALGRGSVSIAK